MPLVYGVCLKYFKNKTTAQDAVMDIYELVSKKLKSHKVDNLKSWLYVVAKNHCMEKLRSTSNRRKKESVAVDMYSQEVFHPDDSVKETRLTQMEDCMKELSREQEACIQSFYYKSKSYQTIAAEQELEWNKVRSYIQNGRRKLKKCMDAKNKKRHV